MDDQHSAAWACVAENWKRMRGAVRRRWKKVRSADLDAIQGNRQNLAELIQQRYSITLEEAYQQIADWLEIVEC